VTAVRICEEIYSKSTQRT